ncbi:MAG: hypothetical protein Q8K24_09450 [Hydrogenophaga sp.]|nr:hypothetical protein [Hydrogenophaga sp.]
MKTKTIKTTALEQKRTALANRLTELRSTFAALEARVESGRCNGGSNQGGAPNADPGAVAALPGAKSELQKAETDLALIERELAKLKAAAEAPTVKARCDVRLDELKAEIRRHETKRDAHASHATALGAEQALATAAAEAAKDAAADALSTPGAQATPVTWREHYDRADLHARAAERARASAAQEQARIDALRAQLAEVQAEADVAEVESASAALAGPRDAFMAAAHRQLVAERRLYGREGMTRFDFQSMYRSWLDEQAGDAPQ